LITLMNSPNKFKVLIIDDDPAHRIMIKRALQALPAITEIELASSISTALKKITPQNTYNLIMVDLNLNNESGLDLVSVLRADFSLTELPILVISTSQLTSDIYGSYQAGANCYLLKESDPAIFHEHLIAAARFFLGLATLINSPATKEDPCPGR
jgi:DNA-binding NarL/FixJ family response regulator